jgi:hypothetical protein
MVIGAAIGVPAAATRLGAVVGPNNGLASVTPGEVPVAGVLAAGNTTVSSFADFSIRSIIRDA